MQGIAETEKPAQRTWIEIRSSIVPIPASAPTDELCRLGVRLIERSRLVDVSTGSDPLDADTLNELFDPRVESAHVDGGTEDEGCWVDVLFLPGVTDAEGESAERALSLAGLDGARCRTGLRYRFATPVDGPVRTTVERLLGNAVVHHFLWSDEDRIDRPIEPDPDLEESAEIIEMAGMDSAALLALSRERHLALDLAEMQAVRTHFQALGRAPTDVEMQSIALTWSEHCSHKTFRATVQFEHDGRHESIDGLLQTCISGPSTRLNRPWVRSRFADNAGVVAFDGSHDLAIKVETHNHPSALEPFGGAHTGVGGVIRDVLAMSAEPIANTDVLCFGPPDLPVDHVPAGVFHPARTREGVTSGVADYGNNMGIPTVGGAILYHHGYIANPLVFCGTVGMVPRDAHPREPRSGDQIVVLGGRTGRDGLHGATMSSTTLDRAAVAGTAVQIGNPITEKMVRDVLPLLRDERLYHAITDCGAGGLCSAVGEMGERLGVDVRLEDVPLKYRGLKPWEIWLSEAQERMVLAVPDSAMLRLLELCRSYGVEAAAIGRFRDDGLLHITYRERTVADLSMRFLHRGRPPRRVQARWTSRPERTAPAETRLDAGRAILDLLAHPNIASKESTIRRYDHEVGGATVIKPLVGNAGPSDAAVLRPLFNSFRGVAIAHGINPLYGDLDPHAMALLAVDEALRNLVAVGGSIDRAALLDNFCWGEVDDPVEMGALVRAAQGCRDAVTMYRTPFVSGKDSLRNTSQDGTGRRSIPRTLLISAIGVLPDVRRTTTMDLKSSGNPIYLLGLTADELGGSHYLWYRGIEGGTVPQARPTETPRLMRRLTRAIRQGAVRACHDLSEGGLAVAAAEMALAGRLGLHLDLDAVSGPVRSPESLLFSESPGRWLVEVDPDRAASFERTIGDLPCAHLGHVAAHPHLVIRQGPTTLADLAVPELDTAWKRHEHAG